MIAVLVVASGHSDEVVVRTPSGNNMTVEISSEESFGAVIHQIDSMIAALEPEYQLCAESRGFLLDYMFGSVNSRKATVNRNYSVGVSGPEKEDIKYIVTTLAKSSWTSLLRHKSSLKRAGDRVDHVHPFRFLMCILTDEEMKSCFHSIKGRGGKIWHEFFEGLSESLDDEAKKNNLRPEFVQDFANNVGLNSQLIAGTINDHRWSEFVDTLLQHIPRSGQPDRYDM